MTVIEATTVTYPRFIGVDSNADFVWELENGRWTWADDPYQAAKRERTFTPDRYLEKYGPVTTPVEHGFLTKVVDVTSVSGSADADKELVSRVLYALLVNLDGWIDGAHDNHEAMGHRGENIGEECWRQFAPADIRNMINDVAREFGVSEFPRPDKGKEEMYR